MRRYRTRIKGKKEEKSNIVRLFTVLAALTSQPYGGVLLSRFIRKGYFTLSRHHDVRRASNISSFLDFYPECLSQKMANWISAVLVIFNWLDKREIFTTVCRCSANIFSLSLLWCLCCILRMSSWNITRKHVVSKHQKALEKQTF